MADHNRQPRLRPDQARRLLARLGDVEVESISVTATTNDVFRVVTRGHGIFYVKFYTARWYADQPDPFFVAEREAAVHELLDKRGIGLPYTAWADTSRAVVEQSVFICGDLPGLPVTEAIAAHPGEAATMLRALGSYLRRLHHIEFSSPGMLCPAHARAAQAEGRIPPVEAWDGHELHHPEHAQQAALGALADRARRHLLPAEAAAALERLFALMAETVGPEYSPPRLTVGNCHAWHFHVARSGGEWQVEGCYDFEAASAGCSAIDLTEMEVTLTPSTRSFSWRDPLFDGYGSRPSFEGHKLRLLYYLICDLGNNASTMIPDPRWLAERWPSLTRAQDWKDLLWFPVQEPAGA